EQGGLGRRHRWKDRARERGGAAPAAPETELRRCHLAPHTGLSIEVKWPEPSFHLDPILTAREHDLIVRQIAPPRRREGDTGGGLARPRVAREQPGAPVRSHDGSSVHQRASL